MLYISFIIIAIILCLLCNFLIIKLLKIFIRKLVNYSLGYIVSISYEKLNIFCLSISSITIKISGNSISIVKIPYIKLKLSYNKITLEISTDIDLKGNNIIKFARLNKHPLLLINVRRIFNIKLLNPLSINLYSLKGKNREGLIYIKSLKFHGFKTNLKGSSFEFKFTYKGNEAFEYAFHLNSIIMLGKSTRTKRYFLKSIEIKKFKISFPRSKITALVLIEYKFAENPSGHCIIFIQNSRSFTKDLFKNKTSEIKKNIDSFFDYMMLSSNETDDLRLNCKFTEDSVLINNKNLSDIRKSLRT